MSRKHTQGHIILQNQSKQTHNTCTNVPFCRMLTDLHNTLTKNICSWRWSHVHSFISILPETVGEVYSTNFTKLSKATKVNKQSNKTTQIMSPLSPWPKINPLNFCLQRCVHAHMHRTYTRRHEHTHTHTKIKTVLKLNKWNIKVLPRWTLSWDVWSQQEWTPLSSSSPCSSLDRTPVQKLAWTLILRTNGN